MSSGRHNKPTFTEMWLPHKNSDHQSFLQDGTAEASGTVYSIAQNRMDSGVIEDEPKFVVINNGTGVQIIVLSENINSQKLVGELIRKQMSKKKKIVNNEQHQRKLSDKQVLREVLEDLTEEGQIKKLNLLKESLHHKSDVHKTSKVNEVKV